MDNNSVYNFFKLYIINYTLLIIIIMSKKWIFTLLAWYVAWSVIASMFSKKKWSDIQKELDKKNISQEEKFKILFNNFVSTHENLLRSIKEEVTSEKNKALFNEKKEQFYSLVDEYKVEWEKILEDLKGKWNEALLSGRDKMEELYEEKKKQINEIKGEAPDKAKDVKGKLLAMFEDFKNKLK